MDGVQRSKRCAWKRLACAFDRFGPDAQQRPVGGDGG